MADDSSTPLQVAPDQPAAPAPSQPDVQAPSLQSALQGSQPDTSNLQGVLNASQSAQAHFQPTIGSRLKGVLLGLATGGIPGAVAGGISPTFAQKNFQQVQDVRAAKVKFADAQAASMVAESSQRQKQLANYDEDHQRAVFNDNLNTAEKLMQMGFPPNYTTADDSQSEMAAMQNATATKGAVPPTMSLAVGQGQIMHFDLSSGGGQHAMYEMYAQLQKDLGKPVLNEQMFMSQPPQQRFAMVNDAAHYWNQPATPQSRAMLQSDLETLKSLPDNVAPSNRDATLAHLQQSLGNIDTAITKNEAAQGQADAAKTVAQIPANAAAAAAKKTAETNAEAATPTGRLANAEKVASIKEKEATIREKADTDVVAYDPTFQNPDGTQGGNVVMTRGEAEQKNLNHYKVDASLVNANVAGMNDVQNKINMLASVAADPNKMNKVQAGLAAAMLAHGKGIEVGAFGTHVDLSRVNEKLYQDDVKSANPETMQYVAAMGAAHEAITQLPRLQTFGKSSRMTQQQMEAAQNMLPQPGDAGSPMAMHKMVALQTTIDPLRKQMPHMPGSELMSSWLENQHATAGGQPTTSGQAQQPQLPSALQRATRPLQ